MVALRRRERGGQDARSSTSRPPWLADAARSAIRTSGSGAWAIEQLARRPADTLAGAALARAARGADYAPPAPRPPARWDGFPRRALPALEAAARDTSARVREAAVAALGASGGDRALAASATDAWRRRLELSGAGRRSAGPGQARRAGAREAVLQGLETPSYRDAIQNAAVAAVVQHPDSGLVARPLPAAGRAAVPRDRARGAHGAGRPDGARAWCAGRWTTSERGCGSGCWRRWRISSRRRMRWRCCGRRSRPSGHPRPAGT